MEYNDGKIGPKREAVLKSPVFPPPPLYNMDQHSRFYGSCKVSAVDALLAVKYRMLSLRDLWFASNNWWYLQYITP